MATRTGYHCSPVAGLQFVDGLCVADDRDSASSYLRSGLDATHYLYTVAWDATDVTTADEATMIAVWERITGRKHDEGEISTWDVAKNRKVRAALVAEDYTALVYGDSHEGYEYETTDFLRLPATLRVVAVEEITYGD